MKVRFTNQALTAYFQKYLVCSRVVKSTLHRVKKSPM